MSICKVLVLCFVTSSIDFSLVKTNSIRLRKRYTEDDICHETIKTLKEVPNCPTHYEDFKNRSIEMNCKRFPGCKGQKFFYHCVMSEDKFVEVCAPRSFITGQCCALYDKGLGRIVEDYNRLCAECPVQYESDDYEKTSSCVESNKAEKSNKTLEENTSTPNKSKCHEHGDRVKRSAGCEDGEAQITTIGSQESSTNIVIESNQTNGVNSEINDHTEFSVHIVVPVVIVILVVLLALVIAYHYRKRLKAICLVSKDGLKNVKDNQKRHTLRIMDTTLLETTEECKMLSTNE